MTVLNNGDNQLNDAKHLFAKYAISIRYFFLSALSRKRKRERERVSSVCLQMSKHKVRKTSIVKEVLTSVL